MNNNNQTFQASSLTKSGEPTGLRGETQEEREWREVHERFERMFKKHLGLK